MDYQIGGSLTTDALTYIERQADTDFYKFLKKGEFCYVLNSRQMGKSSLLVRTKHRLEQEGHQCVAVDLTNIGSETITPTQWYKGIVADLWLGFDLVGKINLKNWWKEREEVSLIQKLSWFIDELLNVHFSENRLFVFIDEIDSILDLDFPVDDFLALIRFFYNQRAMQPEYQRITFAIFGVATPSDLIKDKNRTPFNIGVPIELTGFTWQEALPLAQGLNVQPENSQNVLKEILTWTGGQPFLTQKLCQLVTLASRNASNNPLVIPPGTESAWVENIVRSSILEHWESQDEPEHLRTIRDRIEHNGKRAGRMLSIYLQILRAETDDYLPVKTDDSREQMELLLSGLVVRYEGTLRVKNPIYQEIFNHQWVEKQLASLRPYSQTLEAWVTSQKTDESRLLRGQALKDALAWALGKSLSDIDYQYLAASQDLSKRETESALESLEKASQLLSFARRKVKQEPLRHRIWKGWTAVAALGITSSIILFRLTGLLQGIEWNVLDQFFRLRPLEAPDSRIVIVTVDERDINQIGQWPMPDRVLAQALERIKAHRPKVIGLDIYRDLPVEPGHEVLVKTYQSTPNLFGIEKLVGSQVSPPPLLNQLGQIGFIDIVIDADGKVRRGLLSVEHQGQVHLSLTLKLALVYLQAEGITAKPVAGGRLQFGKAIFIPFNSNDGGYVGADAGGYQVLLNFRGLLHNFQTISLADVLANRIPPHLMENRIILIGTTAESLNDFFYTPYSSRLFRSPLRTPGVVVHANLTSQILSSVLDGRPSLQSWSDPQEWLWILVGSSIGTALSWRLKSLPAIACGISLTGTGIVLMTYLAFLRGWWLPVVPPLLGLIGGAIALNIIINKRLEKLQLKRIFELLVQECATSPTAGRIAIEYLKQSESDNNQTLLQQWLKDNNL